jgi:hypothetical protein
MTNVKQAQAQRMKMAERAQQQLQLHFPGVNEMWIWSRKRDAGFISVPRILPVAMQAIDEYSKGAPAGHTLFCLWARSPDHVMVTIENPTSFAVEAGFHGKRAVDTWRKRMKVLTELGFIVPKKGDAGDYNYVLLMNPIVAVERMHQTQSTPRQIRPELYGRFIDRLAQIGAHGQLKAIQEAWDADRAAAQAAAAAAAAAAAMPAPPPPPEPAPQPNAA